MTNIRNANLESNNLDFLNSLTKDKYPTAVLFREHFKKHSPLESLSELLTLETIIHNYKAKKAVDYSQTTWLLRSTILLILQESRDLEEDRGQEHLEKCISSMIGEEALSNAQRIEKLILDSKDHGYSIEDFSSSLGLVKLCLDLREIKIQKIKQA